MTAQPFEGHTHVRRAVIALGLALVMLLGTGMLPAQADEIIMSCGASYGNPSVEFYLPYDGSTVRFAFRVANGPWQFTHWYYSTPQRVAWRWTGNGWANEILLSFAQGGGPQYVEGYVQYREDYPSNTWRFVNACSTSGMHTGGITYTSN